MDRLAADTAIPELLRTLGRWLFALARRLSRRRKGQVLVVVFEYVTRPPDLAHLLRVVEAAASRTIEPAPRIPVC